MAIMVKKLITKGTYLYQMNLIAGRNGLTNLVQWVHIIEDDSVSKFLHGQELVFTAGILNTDKDWLLKFAHKLHEAEVSAFVINIGPHTKVIPQEVIDFCDEVNMPLFTIPWETRMVDMTRDFCRRIMNNDHVENSMATTIKNIIFKVGDLETQVLQMERYGYQRDSKFCFVSIFSDNQTGESMEEHKDALSLFAEKIARNIQELFISFSYKEYLVLVLVDYSDMDIDNFVKNFLKLIEKEKTGWRINLGVSSNLRGICNQDKNFERSFSAMEMAKQRKETVSFYDSLGLYKILYAVNDKEVLRTYYKDTIGKLEEYDKENHTELESFLRTYLENNASPQLVSEKQYIHRNTVTNQLKKIQKIIGYDPLDLEDRVKLYIGFYIKDIL